MAAHEEETQSSWFYKSGLVLAGACYLVSAFYVNFFGASGSSLSLGGERVLTVAHWQLEDGFREGLDEAFREFEKIQAQRGVKVRVLQSTVPARGYPQWFLTQMIGGNPADIIELSGSSALHYRYFTPLSPYIGKPNPYNEGTPLEGMTWKDSYLDGMESSLDPVYAEYYGVGLGFFTYRLHVNLELLEKITGSAKMPTDLKEWLDICQQVKGYSDRVGEPISAIGVRGFDRGTLSSLLSYYYSQMNGNLNDYESGLCDGKAGQSDILAGVRDGRIPLERLTAVAGIVRDLGQYFMDGFTAIDLEQAKYMFYTGKVVFFPEGSWNTYSLVRNSRFKVGIVPLPVIGNHPVYGKYYTGKIAETGARIGCKFGIPKASRNFPLALELWQFVTSYRQNQAVMDRCKWLPGVKHAEFRGILESCKPEMEGNLSVANPLLSSNRSSSGRKQFECLESIIIEHAADAEARFLQSFNDNKEQLREELTEVITNGYRANFEREMKRSQISLGLQRERIQPEEKDRLQLMTTLGEESYAENIHSLAGNRMYIRELNDM